jgi:uracil-DNA glycosylase family 4
MKTGLNLQKAIDDLQAETAACRACPRLVEWREEVARQKVARFQEMDYWGKPVPSLGRSSAHLLVVGLAPAAHGGNRTGRIFTGDRSGDWLYRALHRFGFASQPHSINRFDGLKLIDSYITAVIHCAPPLNKPSPDEIARCRPFLEREKDLLRKIRAIVCLGRVAYDAIWQLFHEGAAGKKPPFGHGLEIPLKPGLTLLASFHPSQQNTFTGRLTEPMLDEVFARARELLG